MKFNYEIKEYNGVKVFHVTITGVTDKDKTADAIQEAIAEGEPLGIEHVLWDLRKSVASDSFMEIHNFMESLGNMGIQLNYKIAIVYKSNANLHKHAENVIINRGFSGFCYFTDIDEALQWLVSD